MNWFKLYIGDYQRDTAHLSVTEHGAYLLMLQHYYATEKPLPTGKALHRMLRAQDKAERDAIDTVAVQFWRTTDAGLVNDRADAEITKAGAQAETNRAIAQAREDRRKAARNQHDESTNRATKVQPNQTPDTRHQKNQESVESVPPEPTRAGIACRRMRESGLQDTNPAHPTLLALLAAGITDDELAAAAEAAVAKGKPFAYALAVAEGRRRDAAAVEPLPEAPPTPEREAERRASEQAEATKRLLAQQKADALAARTPEAEKARHDAIKRLRGHVASVINITPGAKTA